MKGEGEAGGETVLTVRHMNVRIAECAINFEKSKRSFLALDVDFRSVQKNNNAEKLKIVVHTQLYNSSIE